MSFENTSNIEQSGLQETKLPSAHLEGMDNAALEGFSDPEKYRLIGQHYFREEASTSPGIMAAFRKVSDTASEEAFAEGYARYVDEPAALETEAPQLYEFFRDRVFCGREYRNGMEKFLRDTAPRSAENTEQAPVFAELYSPDAAVLSKTGITDYRITNCENPFSYGNAGEMAKKMDFIKGDTALLSLAPDRMVACRNLMALCGKEFRESDVTQYAVDNEFMAYDPLYLKGFSQGSNEIVLPRIIEGMSGVQTYQPELSETGDPAEAMAVLLDHGHRGIVTYNPALLNRTDAEAASPMGKLLDKIPHSASETATLLCAVREGSTGKTAGFMICDSTKNDAARYVEADRLIKALEVKDGMTLFTKDPYLEK